MERAFWQLLFSFARGDVGESEVTQLNGFIRWARGELKGISEHDDTWFQQGS